MIRCSHFHIYKAEASQENSKLEMPGLRKGNGDDRRTSDIQAQLFCKVSEWKDGHKSDQALMFLSRKAMRRLRASSASATSGVGLPVSEARQ